MQNDVSGTVHGPVVQARDIGTVNIHATKPTYAPLTSWHERPELTPELRDLLKAQLDVAVTLPYDLVLDKKPHLADVYVQGSALPHYTEQVEPEAKDDRERSRETKPVEREPEHTERILQIKQVLDTGRHVLITGGPGSGKSTLGLMYVQELAKQWLDVETGGKPPLLEPVMPLRISAKALAYEGHAWSELLAKAANRYHLNAPLDQNLFAYRALGARWLVFVDGLDEIVEPEHLRRVLDVISARVRHGTDHQLVITSRELPVDALGRLQGPDIDRYRIQPFGAEQLEDFALAWFRIQDPPHARMRADDFLRQVRDGRLRELVSVPLLATIAAIVNTLAPERELPQNRVDLFERFLTDLLNDKISRRTTISELRRTIDDKARLDVVEWIYEHRIELIEHLAVQRLESESSLVDIAAKWVGRPCPPEDLEAVLTSIGVFAQGGQGLDFLHRLFAEFLAARKRAPEIPADFPTLDDWVDQGTQQAKETFVIFTFVLWGREEGNDIGLVMKRLLDGGREHVLLAAKLVAESVTVPDELTTGLMDRLLELVLAIGVDSTSLPDVNGICRTLGSLSGSVITGELTRRLRDLQHNAELPQVTRVSCAIALGHLGMAEESAGWLEREFEESPHPETLGLIARGLADICPGGADHAERLALRHATSADEADYSSILTAAQILLDLKRREAASRLIRRAVRHMRDNNVPRQGDHRLPGTSNARHDESVTWSALMKVASEARCAEEALWAADMVLAQSDVSPFQFRSAVETVGAYGDGQTIAAMAGKMRPTSSGLKVYAASELRTTHPQIAARLAGDVASDPAAPGREKITACGVLADIEPETAATLIKNLEGSDPLELAQLATVVAATGGAAEPLARRALAGSVADAWVFRRTASHLLGLEGFAPQVHDAAITRSAHYWAKLAPLLHGAGYHELSADLVERLINTETSAELLSDCLADFHDHGIPELAQPLVEKLTTLLDDSDTAAARQVARLLRRAGRVAEAIGIAERAFLRELDGLYTEECAGVLLDVAGSSYADFITGRVVSHGMSSVRRTAVAREFVSRGLVEQAATIWADALRRHASMVPEGVEIADQLVRCGYRRQAIEIVKTVLGDNSLPATTRTSTRALLAWLEAMAPE